MLVKKGKDKEIESSLPRGKFSFSNTRKIKKHENPFQVILMNFFTENLWVGWIVVEKPVVIFSFFAPSIKSIRTVGEELKQRFSDITSIETVTGGEGFHYSDWRTDHIMEMAKKYKKLK